MTRLLALGLAVTLAAVACKRAPERYYAVCVEMPDPDASEARRGIEWWGTLVWWDCVAPDLYVHHDASPPVDHPRACGWYDGHDLVWVCGPVFDVVRHEWGHVLGYGDSEFGVMASGDWED